MTAVRIVILDQLAFSEEQIERLEKLGSLDRFNDFPNEMQTRSRLEHADVVISGWTTLNRTTLESAKNLQLISLALTGYDVVDLEAAGQLGVTVTNVPHYSRQSVAEYAFALTLAGLRRVASADRQVRDGQVLSPHVELLGGELYGKTLGIIGLGSIGSWMARIGNGFGMRVIANSRADKDAEEVEMTSLERLLRESDIMMVALDVNQSSIGLLDRERLSWMKRGAFLVNIASNQVVDERAIVEMLESGHLGGAAFDDISHTGHDDLDRDTPSPLLAAPNVVLSPQAGWYTVEAQRRLLDLVIRNTEQWAIGEPTNVVSPTA